jgi:hypothetical protein
MAIDGKDYAVGSWSAGQKEFANTILGKSFKIYYFENTADNKTVVKDISKLDINDKNADENEWGGITSFSSRASDIIAKMYGEI